MAAPAPPPAYPVRVAATLDPEVSRGLWLVKWLLAIPHYVVLAFLWLAFVVLSVVAFFAILFTGRYPRAIFDFNVGVLRWSWRVSYYAYGALGTDRYPPFSLREKADYPAHLDVDPPEHLSRILVLVKWWLLAIPHYLVVGIFVSGGIYLTRTADESPGWWTPGGVPVLWDAGLIGLLVLIAAVAMLFTGSYPRPLFDLVVGLNRWVLRVAAYAGLMTDRYPPFRLDLGGDDPGDRTARGVPEGVAPDATERDVLGPDDIARPAPAFATASPTSRWGPGRVVAVVLASALLLLSLGLLAAGTTAGVAGWVARDNTGFLMSPTRQLSTGTYALTSPTLDVRGATVANLPHRMIGDAKVTATAQNGKPIFVGLARTGATDTYLSEVRHATVAGSFTDPEYRISGHRPPPVPPRQSSIWMADASGVGTQSVVAPFSDGRWTVVVMNADGSAGVDTALSFGVTAPGLDDLTTVLLSVGGVALVCAAVVLVVAIVGARPRPAPAPARDQARE